MNHGSLPRIGVRTKPGAAATPDRGAVRRSPRGRGWARPAVWMLCCLSGIVSLCGCGIATAPTAIDRPAYVPPHGIAAGAELPDRHPRPPGNETDATGDAPLGTPLTLTRLMADAAGDAACTTLALPEPPAEGSAGVSADNSNVIYADVGKPLPATQPGGTGAEEESSPGTPGGTSRPAAVAPEYPAPTTTAAHPGPGGGTPYDQFKAALYKSTGTKYILSLDFTDQQVLDAPTRGYNRGVARFDFGIDQNLWKGGAPSPWTPAAAPGTGSTRSSPTSSTPTSSRRPAPPSSSCASRSTSASSTTRSSSAREVRHRRLHGLQPLRLL